MSAEGTKLQSQTIKISKFWEEELKSMPYLSRKYHPFFLKTTTPINFIEKNGKTLHLLKSKAKPTATDRQRKKIPIKGSFVQYLDSKRKADAQNWQLNVPGVIQQKK